MTELSVSEAEHEAQKEQIRKNRRVNIAAQLLAAEISVNGIGRVSLYEVQACVKLADALLEELDK